jgi:hypothetical protein
MGAPGDALKNYSKRWGSNPWGALENDSKRCGPILGVQRTIKYLRPSAWGQHFQCIRMFVALVVRQASTLSCCCTCDASGVEFVFVIEQVFDPS